jgi:uncharacterized protein (TIGR03435 family)
MYRPLSSFLALACFALAYGQPSPTAGPAPTFDVASLKPAPPPSGRISIDLGNTSHGRVTLTNVTLSECLRFAFKIYTDAQIAGPEWIKDHRTLFNIVGQAPPDTPRDRLCLMTLNLLTERFGLALHHESRQLPYLALVVDKNGPKMHETKEDSVASSETVRAGRIAYRHVSPLALAVLLTRFAEQPIIDMTGLKGQYDIQLEWTPDTLNARNASNPAAEPVDMAATPSLFTAVREQLGLRLEARKGPMDVVVVDHAGKVPIGN